MAFASVLYPGRCLASQPIHLGSEVGEGQRCKRGRLRPPPQASPGGERQVDGQHHRLCPMALTALCHSAAAVSSICSFDSSSSFPSPRGIPGHLDRPRRSRPDPSLPLHRHYLRRCCRRRRHCRCLCFRLRCRCRPPIFPSGAAFSLYRRQRRCQRHRQRCSRPHRLCHPRQRQCEPRRSCCCQGHKMGAFFFAFRSNFGPD